MKDINRFAVKLALKIIINLFLRSGFNRKNFLWRAPNFADATTLSFLTCSNLGSLGIKLAYLMLRW